jgi:hypothetical protein
VVADDQVGGAEAGRRREGLEPARDEHVSPGRYDGVGGTVNGHMSIGIGRPIVCFYGLPKIFFSKEEE